MGHVRGPCRAQPGRGGWEAGGRLPGVAGAGTASSDQRSPPAPPHPCPLSPAAALPPSRPQFKRSFKRNDKPVCVAAIKFIAHLANQQVVHELLPLEILLLLLEVPSDDSVEVAIDFVKEVRRRRQRRRRCGGVGHGAGWWRGGAVRGCMRGACA